MPQAFGGEEEVFDFVSHPDTEGFSTSSGTISVGAKDESSPNSFSKLMLGIVSAKEAVFDELARSFAMRALGDFELGIEILEF